MTDEGAFERLATAILREWDSRYHILSHTGVNAQGKTVKSPVDGFAFIPGANPPHIIAVHHTICAARDLEKKWLHDPATVKPRDKRKGPRAPAGDVIKTLTIVAKERQRTRDLQTTLVLTTNQEPGPDLLRDLNAVATAGGIVIDLWHRSRLAHFLDNDPRGQWLRRQFLGTTVTQLSGELLAELSLQSLSEHKLPDDPAAWVPRSLDRTINAAADQRIVLLIAESGAGKTIACYKRLQANASAGGFSLVLTDEIIGTSLTLEQAVEKALLQLCPSLDVGCGSVAFRLAEPNRPLLLSVEDINRSGRASMLIERIARWGDAAKGKNDSAPWQLLCPVWPEIVSSVQREDVKRQISAYAIFGSLFSAEEGTAAVLHRRSLKRRPVTNLEAAEISDALGHDPLLIALHEPATAGTPTEIIGQFVESCLQHLSSKSRELSASEYRRAIQEFAKTMLIRRALEPSWNDVLGWPSLGPYLSALRHLVLEQRELIRLSGSSRHEKIAFRHDRVREWLLAEAASEMLRGGNLPDDIAQEPHYAEIFGASLMSPNLSVADVAKLAGSNVLALFCALHHFREPTTAVHIAIIDQLNRWLAELQKPATRHNRYLHWEALRVLADAEGPNIRPLVEKLGGNSWNALRARYRNGDLMAGVELCRQTGLGRRVVGSLQFLDHVKARYGSELIVELAALLESDGLDSSARVGALRLSGHIGEPVLANALRACWRLDTDRAQRIEEYLWACAECADSDPESLLKPICDAWACLPNERTDEIRSRNDLAAHSVRFAFEDRGLPDDAIKYLLERARVDLNLNWPITFLLHGVDHPDVVEFMARAMAAVSERGGLSMLSMTMRDGRQRRQDMSARSRERLARIWQDISESKQSRKAAFSIWCSTNSAGDLDVLRDMEGDDLFGDVSLSQRLRRGDHSAIPALLSKLASYDQPSYWWQFGRYVWSDQLTDALDRAFERRSQLQTGGQAGDTDDWLLSDLLTRLPVLAAEELLIKHWAHLRGSAEYVIAALYIATPRLTAAAAEVIRAAENPAAKLELLTIHFGYHVTGHPGIFRREQIEAVLPYLDLLHEREIEGLWSACNENRLFALRRAHLDARMNPQSFDSVFLDEARIREALDKFAEKNDPFIDLWLDRFVQTGASLDEIVGVIDRWLQDRNDLAALEVTSSALLHLGERRHVTLLQKAAIEPLDVAAEVISATEFGIKRRTLQ